MNLPLIVPNHTTVSRQAVATFASHKGVVHVLIDSTGLKVYGARCDWRKLHLAMDADNFSIVAHAPSDSHTDDPSQGGVVQPDSGDCRSGHC